MIMFNSIYKNRRVLITGHTGFKGSWLALWLTELGAEVIGYSTSPPTFPNHFDLLGLPVKSITADIRDYNKLLDTFIKYQPEVVFHLAAQPLVRFSYKEPRETFETNIMGTVNVLDACKSVLSVRAVVNITSDKCYENREWVWGYRENDPMGGYDPYSASKGCSELVTSAWRNSFFHPDEYGKSHNILAASARAGNVIGGGDWADDRLIPDIMKAASRGEKVVIRNPSATRPWQHVLEPLSGYLCLGQKLLEGKPDFAQAWNFGPSTEEVLSVRQVLEYIKQYWDAVTFEIQQDLANPHEASLLKLDCSKSDMVLKWRSIWGKEDTIARTVNWYRQFYEKQNMLSVEDLIKYTEDARAKQIEWAL
ncbi:CDP-glucose 4,6-dehydratase [Desulfonema limicola]|uniref:CDP-glucose 4,6-dehydratase n=1 Tax=Desulfonema limicola TaxID=45656 RepID=A0A975B5M8_9BACT|nr:CDP-glucose 4,6-dehydratase [Desulfonema limicola]QTA79194.1 CDP-glucose 4,6-dehydratase [Desulfonema limicola]